MLHRMMALITKELIQITRDRVLLFFALFGPTAQLMMLGRAISMDIVDIPVAVVDYDLSSLSREIITALDNTNELQVLRFPASLDEAREMIDNGDVMAVVVISHGFMEGTRSAAEVAQIQVVLDGGSSSFMAARTLGAAQGAVQSLVEDAQVTGNLPTRGGVQVLVEALFNRTLDLRPHTITAQLALITFQITTMVAVMGIVREREIGTIEMLTITPLRRLELIGGKAITPFLIGMLDFVVMFNVTQAVFSIPMRGSLPVLMAVTMLYLFCEIGYALMLSTITRSQQQAVTMVFVWAMFAITLSGYLVPVSRLPPFLQWVSWFVPLRHYLAILRGLMLKGAGLGVVWPQVLTLAALTAVILFATTRSLSRVIE